MSRLWSDVKSVADPAKSITQIEGATALKVRLHRRLLDILNLAVLDRTPRETLRLEIRGAVVQLLADEKRLLTPHQTDQLIDDLLDEILGLGPLEPLLKDDSVTDILVNTHDAVYVERGGRLERTDVQFQDTRHLVRDHQQDRCRRRPPGRRVLADGRCASGGRITGQRHHPAAGGGWSADVDPQVRPHPDRHRQAYRVRQHDRGNGQGRFRDRPGSPQRAHLRRHRLRQDHAAQRLVGVHQPPRAHRHHRGFRGAPAAAASRGPPGNPTRRTSKAKARSPSASW